MRFLWMVAVSGMVLTAPASAAGGGGGGGGFAQAPSASTPQYDPAVEYRAGVAALEAKDFKKAKTSFDRVIAVAAADANVQYLAGVARTGLLHVPPTAPTADAPVIFAFHGHGGSARGIGDRYNYQKHWPEAIGPDDLGNPELWAQCRAARAALLAELGLSELSR